METEPIFSGEIHRKTAVVELQFSRTMKTLLLVVVALASPALGCFKNKDDKMTPARYQFRVSLEPLHYSAVPIKEGNEGSGNANDDNRLGGGLPWFTMSQGLLINSFFQTTNPWITTVPDQRELVSSTTFNSQCQRFDLAAADPAGGQGNGNGGLGGSGTGESTSESPSGGNLGDSNGNTGGSDGNNGLGNTDPGSITDGKPSNKGIATP